MVFADWHNDLTEIFERIQMKNLLNSCHSFTQQIIKWEMVNGRKYSNSIKLSLFYLHINLMSALCQHYIATIKVILQQPLRSFLGCLNELSPDAQHLKVQQEVEILLGINISILMKMQFCWKVSRQQVGARKRLNSGWKRNFDRFFASKNRF